MLNNFRYTFITVLTFGALLYEIHLFIKALDALTGLKVMDIGILISISSSGYKLQPRAWGLCHDLDYYSQTVTTPLRWRSQDRNHDFHQTSIIHISRHTWDFFYLSFNASFLTIDFIYSSQRHCYIFSLIER